MVPLPLLLEYHNATAGDQQLGLSCWFSTSGWELTVHIRGPGHSRNSSRLGQGHFSCPVHTCKTATTRTDARRRRHAQIDACGDDLPARGLHARDATCRFGPRPPQELLPQRSGLLGGGTTVSVKPSARSGSSEEGESHAGRG